MWTVKEEGDDIIVDCKSMPTCPHDGSLEKLLTSKLLNFDLEPGSGKRDAHAIDMECRCQRCGHLDTFGVALSKSEYIKLYRLLHVQGLIKEATSDFGVITGMMINPDALGSDMDKNWTKTYSATGHTPKFNVMCYHCGKRNIESEMFFRYAFISNMDDAINKVYGMLNQIEYKCIKCAWTTKFLVEAPADYLLKVQDIREKQGFNRNLYYMTPEEWLKNKEIEKQLSALGYMGGREDI